jgi:hypothetical protein
MNTPSVVLAAFAPETEYDLDVEAVLVLEALDCAYITGSRRPGVRDAMLSLLAMTDLAALKDARRRGTVEELIAAAGRGRPPRELMARLPAIAAAIAAATGPAPETPAADAQDDAEDPLAALEKKTAPAPAGG